MRAHWYEPFDSKVGVSVRATDVGATTSWEFFVNLPHVGRVHAEHDGAPLSWLRERLAAGAALTLFLPGRFPGYLFVGRWLWHDRDLGDVPIAFSWRSAARVPA